MFNKEIDKKLIIELLEFCEKTVGALARLYGTSWGIELVKIHFGNPLKPIRFFLLKAKK